VDPDPNSTVDPHGMYRGVDGHMHHVGSDPARVPDQAEVDRGGGVRGYMGASQYWGADGQVHQVGSLEETSTGQTYYVDSHGHGHVFYPANTPGAQPESGAIVDAQGMYRGVDGHTHHVGSNPSEVPAQEAPASRGVGGHF
jgi:hypothetical protein